MAPNFRIQKENFAFQYAHPLTQYGAPSQAPVFGFKEVNYSGEIGLVTVKNCFVLLLNINKQDVSYLTSNL